MQRGSLSEGQTFKLKSKEAKEGGSAWRLWGEKRGGVGIGVKERKLFNRRSRGNGEIARALQTRPGGHARL